MKARDLTDLALRNLREAIFRNALTTLGVAVGVASLVAMLSLGVGLQELKAKPEQVPSLTGQSPLRPIVGPKSTSSW